MEGNDEPVAMATAACAGACGPWQPAAAAGGRPQRRPPCTGTRRTPAGLGRTAAGAAWWVSPCAGKSWQRGVAGPIKHRLAVREAVCDRCDGCDGAMVCDGADLDQVGDHVLHGRWVESEHRARRRRAGRMRGRKRVQRERGLARDEMRTAR